MNNANPEETPLVQLTVKGTRPSGVTRREAIQWVMGAVAASAAGLTPQDVFSQEVGRTPTPQEAAARVPPGIVEGGYGMDPKLIKTYKPGEVWPLTFDAAQKKTATALADVIIPKDDLGPAGSEVGVVEMVDEWISAPYPTQQADRAVVLNGLAWLEAESTKRFGKGFADLTDDQRLKICDDICFTGTAKPQFARAADFFSKFRSLCAGAYYATPAGWAAIGYVGNIPLVGYDGPPPEVLEMLGVEQTVR